jgi:predicted GH43/DUF377 family glycosyl hydrolase
LSGCSTRNVMRKISLADYWIGARGGWEKFVGNPVLGGNLGTCFDLSILFEYGTYRMWFSWRPKESIAFTESSDGFHWSPPQIVLSPSTTFEWETRVNRPCILFHANQYHMWYTGQSQKRSSIGYATSPDGISWTKYQSIPVIIGDQHWEKRTVMCPSVLWDDSNQQFRMWYSGGGQYEPVAIGHATSPDGIHWEKSAKPILTPLKNAIWEYERVTACHVFQLQGWFIMFYIGFRDIDHAAIGIARSRDGIKDWERHPHNPILSPDKDSWDHDAVYKPYVIWNGSQWMLFYNGRHTNLEQIGVAVHKDEDFGFIDTHP